MRASGQSTCLLRALITAHWLAVCSVAVAMQSLTTPVEIVKIRLQMQGAEPGAVIKSPFAVVRELGIRGMYTGLAATMLRDVSPCVVVMTLLNSSHGSLALCVCRSRST